MNLAKARELLKLDIENPGEVAIEDIHEAQQLSIEAINRLQFLRTQLKQLSLTRLPGETDD